MRLAPFGGGHVGPLHAQRARASRTRAKRPVPSRAAATETMPEPGQHVAVGNRLRGALRVVRIELADQRACQNQRFHDCFSFHCKDLALRRLMISVQCGAKELSLESIQYAQYRRRSEDCQEEIESIQADGLNRSMMAKPMKAGGRRPGGRRLAGDGLERLQPSRARPARGARAGRGAGPRSRLWRAGPEGAAAPRRQGQRHRRRGDGQPHLFLRRPLQPRIHGRRSPRSATSAAPASRWSRRSTEAAAAWNIDSARGRRLHRPVHRGRRPADRAGAAGGKLPFVAVDLDAGPGASSILIDDRDGARMATEHLLGARPPPLRHPLARDRRRRANRPGRPRRGGRAPQYGATRDRLAGYEEALAAAGIDFDSVPIIEAFNDRTGAPAGAADAPRHGAGHRRRSSPCPTCSASPRSRRPRRARLAVPGDLSVVGYRRRARGGDARSRRSPRSRQPIVEKGRLAARMIFDPGPPRKEVLPVELVVRGSTAAPRS